MTGVETDVDDNITELAHTRTTRQFKTDDSDDEGWEINAPLRHEPPWTDSDPSSQEPRQKEESISFKEWESIISELLDESLGSGSEPRGSSDMLEKGGPRDEVDPEEGEEEEEVEWEQAWP